MKKYRLILVYLLLVSLILAGGAFFLVHALPEKMVAVHGTVTRDGKPLEWEGDEPRLLVWFFPIDRTKNTSIYLADSVWDKGTFTIAKIPTGTYTIAIQQNAGTKRDLLNLAYDPAHSTLQYKVTHDGQEFHIDLPKNLPPAARPGMPA